MADPRVLERLAAARHVRLTTFRRDGTPVPTPVWLVRSGDRLLVTTTTRTGKVKRLRHTPQVLLVPSDARGRPREGAVEVQGTAELVTDPAALAELETLVRRRYGFRLTVARLANRLRGGRAGAEIGIRIRV